MKILFNTIVRYFSYPHSTKNPEVVRRNSLTIIVGVTVAFFNLLMFVTRILLEGAEASITIWILPVTSVLLILSQFAIKFYNQSKVSTYFMLIIGTMTIFIRAASTGGITSPVTIWMTLAPTCAIMLLPLRDSLIWTGISVAYLIPLSFPETFGLQISQWSSSSAIEFIVIGIFIMVFSMVIFFYERERIRNEKVLIESEKKLAMNNRLIALGNISGGLSHEINNPLAIVKGNVDLVQLRLDLQKDLTGEELSIPLEEMKRNILRIQGIIDSMRTFTNDDFFISTDLILLNPIIEAAFETRSAKLKKYKIDLKVEVSPGTKVRGNRESILRIFLNLIDNSIDEIRNSTSRWIKVTSSEDAESVTLTFSDSGNKIKKEIEERIMEPFFSTKPIGYGIGLGLTICHNLMKIQGGSIQYDRDAENTSFTLKFSKILSDRD